MRIQRRKFEFPWMNRENVCERDGARHHSEKSCFFGKFQLFFPHFRLLSVFIYMWLFASLCVFRGYFHLTHLLNPTKIHWLIPTTFVVFFWGVSLWFIHMQTINLLFYIYCGLFIFQNDIWCCLWVWQIKDFKL